MESREDRGWIHTGETNKHWMLVHRIYIYIDTKKICVRYLFIFTDIHQFAVQCLPVDVFCYLKRSLPKDFPYQRSLNYIGQVEQHDGDMIRVQILHCVFLFFIVTDIQLCSPCQLRCAPACGFDHFWLRWNLATWRWHQNILYLDVHPSYNGGMKGVRITMVVPQLFGIGPTCSIGSIGLTLPNLAMQAVAVWIYIYIVAAEPINPIWKCSRAVFGTAFLTASKAQWLLNCLGFCLIHAGYIHVLAAIRRS